jgi:hypothetical protein
MTASELVAACKALGITRDEWAIRWLVALAQRDALLAASGLPECPVATELWRLERLAGEQGTAEQLKALGTLRAHVESCPTCRAREEYGAKHAPPLPDMPRVPGWIRALDFLTSLDERLPGPLRPPKGDDGEGRRMGLFSAGFLSVMAIAIAVVYAFARLAAWGPASNWWQESLTTIAIVPLAYLVGFFLAGTVYDLTRRMANRLVGYVLRGGLILPAIYGTIAAVLPLMRKDWSWSYWPGMVLAFGIVGALGGAMLWVIDRVKGKLPRATT